MMNQEILILYVKTDFSCAFSIIRPPEPASPFVEFDPEQAPVELAAFKNGYICLDGRGVNSLSLDMALQSPALMRQAIPYALEDQIATDIEQAHFAYSKTDEVGKIQVYIIEKALMRFVHELCHRLQLKPIMAVPDYLLLPYFEKSWTLYGDSKKLLVRDSFYSGYAVDLDYAEWMFNLKFNEFTSTKITEFTMPSIHLYHTQEFPTLELNIPELNLQSQTGSFTEFLPNSLHQLKKSCDLLQGEFYFAGELSLNVKYWLLGLASVALFLVIGFGTTVFNYFYLNHSLQSLNQQIQTNYFAIFPDATSVQSPELRIEQKLAGLKNQSGDQGFLDQFAQIGKLLTTVKSTEIKSIDYQNQNLSMTLLFKTELAYNQFIKKLNSLGINYQKNSINEQANGVSAQFSFNGGK